MKKYWVYQVLFFIGSLFLWEIFVRVACVPDYILPSPVAIISEIGKNYLLFLRHAGVTLIEAVLGFGLGVLFASIISIAIVQSKLFEFMINPFIISLQTTPKIALAPLLLLWLGFGLFPKIVISALVCFFPIVINSVKGLNSVDQELIDIFRIYKADKLQMLLKVKIPIALPYFFAGLRTAICLSMVGAVVGEFTGANAGLGYLIIQFESYYNVKGMFGALLLLSLMGVILFSLIRLIEKRVLYWHVSEIDKEGV